MDSPTIWTSAVTGFAGGVLGALGTIFSSYYGPRKMEEWRENRLEERVNGPRKRLLLQMLQDPRWPARHVKTLALVTGTSLEECRRLLVEIGARGKIREEGEEESWGLISRNPFEQQ